MDYVNTILTSSDANAFFGVSSFLCDNRVLETTLRYIAIKNNGGDIEKVKLIKASCTQAGYGDSGNKYTEVRYDDTELLIITPCRSGNELMTIDAQGWTSLDAPPYPVASLLTARSSDTHVYINETKKRAVIFVRTATEKWCELLAACLLRVLPWRFNTEDEENIRLVKAINKQESQTFLEIVDACVKGFDFRASMVKRHLVGWANGFRESQIKQLQVAQESYMENIRKYEQMISDYLDKYGAANDNIIALQSASNDKDEFFEFFTRHKQLGVHQVTATSSGKTLDYSIVDTIEYYDEDEFKRHYNNPNSAIGSCGEETRTILWNIFAEHKGCLRVEAIFRLNNLSSLTVVRGTRTNNYQDTHLPHPHLVNHGCLGANKSHIDHYMMTGDWDLAIEQSIAAVKNLNMGDTVVVSSMIRDIKARMDSCKCIITEDGREMTPREFLTYVRGTNNEGTGNG